MKVLHKLLSATCLLVACNFVVFAPSAAENNNLQRHQQGIKPAFKNSAKHLPLRKTPKKFQADDSHATKDWYDDYIKDCIALGGAASSENGTFNCRDPQGTIIIVPIK